MRQRRMSLSITSAVRTPSIVFMKLPNQSSWSPWWSCLFRSLAYNASIKMQDGGMGWRKAMFYKLKKFLSVNFPMIAERIETRFICHYFPSRISYVLWNFIHLIVLFLEAGIGCTYFHILCWINSTFFMAKTICAAHICLLCVWFCAYIGGSQESPDK